MNELQESLGFSDADKAAWLEVNAKYYADPEQGWLDKLHMHAYPVRSAMVYVMPAYQSPVTGKWIDTPSQRRDDMARNNSRPWEGMESEKRVATQRKASEEKQADAAIESAVVSAWHQLPSEKRALLEQSA